MGQRFADIGSVSGRERRGFRGRRGIVPSRGGRRRDTGRKNRVAGAAGFPM